MEYTIYNESLVYYALRNENGYLLSGGTFGFDMDKIRFIDSLVIAKGIKELNYPDCKIRKVKVIDIGEV